MDPSAWTQRIRAAPQDDSLRLAFAERCEAEDPARAELIRLQIRLAGRGLSHAERKPLHARAKELFDAHAGRWIGPAFRELRWPSLDRGFLTRVTLHPDSSPEVLDALLERHPIRALSFVDPDDEPGREPLPKALEKWAAAPALARLDALDGTETELGAAGWGVLLRSPHLRTLPELVVGDEDCTPEVAAAIAAEPGPRLRRLTFRGYMAGCLATAGVEHLAGAPHLATLERLALWNCGCTAGAGAALAASPYLKNLRELALGLGQYSLNQIGPEGAAALAGGSFPDLRSLDLDFNAVGDAGGSVIAESEGFPALESLSLQANALTNVTVRCFMSAHERMPALATLDLSHNQVDGGGVDFLARCRLMDQLRVLWLYHNQVGPSGVVALANSLKATGLRRLNLTQNPLGKDSAAAVAALVESPFLQGLDRLRIERCGLSDADKEQLREAFGPRVTL